MCVASPWQVAAVREGMSSIIPLPLLSLYTAKMVETAVCGYEEVDIHMLKKVVRCVCVCGREGGDRTEAVDSSFSHSPPLLVSLPSPVSSHSLPPLTPPSSVFPLL